MSCGCLAGVNAEGACQHCGHKPEIDHRYTEQIVCPFCGHEDRDSCEWSPNVGEGEGDGESECGACEKEFAVSRHVSISYSTEAKR